MPAAPSAGQPVPEEAVPAAPDADDASDQEEALTEVIEVLKEPEEVPVQEEVPAPQPAPEVEILHSSEGGSLRMEILPAEAAGE